MFNIIQRKITYPSVSSLAIVVNFDVVKVLIFQLTRRWPGVQVDKFFIDGGVFFFDGDVLRLGHRLADAAARIPTDGMMPFASARLRNSWLVYCLPRSE